MGVILVTAIVACTAVLAVVVLRDPLGVAGNILQSGLIRTIAFALIAVAAIWVAIILGTYLISRPSKLTSKQRTLGGIAVALLTFLVSAPLGVASAYSFETARVSGNVFGSEGDSKSQTRPTLEKNDPWADKPQVNILLLGGDSGAGRDTDEGVRTDTMMMATIDTATGATLITQLPRNLQNPIFTADSPLAQVYPYGFDDGGDSFLSSVWHDAPINYPEYFQDTDYAGADALKWAWEGVTGQKIDYFVLVNIDGLVNLIDAMGGVTVNVNFPIAKEGSSSDYDCGIGGYIPEGPDQHLNGTDAMWYARSRCNSPNGDFGRMQRQSCLVNAVINQADPPTMLTRYEDIASAAGDMVSTDIPQEHLSAMVDLAGRVQAGHIVNRISFVHEENGFNAAYPDFNLIQTQISDAIESTKAEAAANDEPEQPAEPETTTAPEPAETTEQAPEVPEETAAEEPTGGQAENVADACAYQHEEPEGDWVIPDTVPVYTPPESEPAQTGR